MFCLGVEPSPVQENGRRLFGRIRANKNTFNNCCDKVGYITRVAFTCKQLALGTRSFC
jgi:hypothetical protein